MKKQALGKGLKAFLPDDYGILKEEKYVEVDVEDLKPNPLQPREDFDPESLEELARSLRETGVLQPIVVVPEGNQYRIVVGERRWRAAQKAGVPKIPAVVRQMSEEQQVEASLIENLQRKDLNPIEIARAYQRLIDKLHLTQEAVAEKVGKDRTSVANYIRLLKLPEEVQKMLADGELTMGHARALLPLESLEEQVFLARLIVQKQLSVREAEKMVSEIRKPRLKAPRKQMDPDLTALQDALVQSLGTKVTLSGTPDKGVIRIYYFSLEELNRITEKIKGVGP